jgi:hypothetical protein
MDLEMLIVIAIGILVLAYLVNRAMGSVQPQTDETYVPPRGQERPHYDDPGVRGRGTFGRGSRERKRTFPFGNSPKKYPNPAGGMKKPAEERTKKRYDDEDIEGQGSFGR